jgi:hypothetical protein
MNWYTLRRARGALILIVIGVAFLLEQMHVLPWDGAWPIILIGIGIVLLAESLLPTPPPPPMPGPPQYPNPYGYAPPTPPVPPPPVAPAPENPQTGDWK